MKISIKLNEDDIRQILSDYLYNKYQITALAKDLEIQVKSKQNYRSEWETANIRLEQELSQ